jgi:hypothetical protein
VTINGSGPFDFILDTGCTDSVIDQKLAAELSLPIAGNINLTTHKGDVLAFLFHTDSLSMAGATVRGLNLSAVNRYAHLVPKARGVLGEDFLRNFDLLIDYRHLQFESAAGPLADSLDGEHLPFHRNGLYHGELTYNRLVVDGHIGASGDKDLTLLLDSGTPIFLLFAKLNKSTFKSQQATPSVSGIVGGSFDVNGQTALGLRLGRALFSHVTVFTPALTVAGIDVDGLLPTSLFRSIYISHSGGFVILNPSAKDPTVKPALAQLAPRSLPDSAISP